MKLNPVRMHAADLMPRSLEAQQILEQRAQQFSGIKQNESIDASDIYKYICFTLGSNERYGIPYQYVLEVMNTIQVTKLPNVKAHIYGLTNRHGTLIALIDLKQFFGTQGSAYTENARIIVIKAQNMTLGILADNIIDSNVYEPEKLDPPLMVLDRIKPEFILGLHQAGTAIINVESLVSSADLQINK